MVQRAEKVAGLLRRELASIVQHCFEHELPKSLFSITDVEVARDLSHAKVYVSIFEVDQVNDVLEFLQEHAGVIRHELGKRVRLRLMPTLKFLHDDSSESGARIEALLSKARRS